MLQLQQLLLLLVVVVLTALLGCLAQLVVAAVLAALCQMLVALLIQALQLRSWTSTQQLLLQVHLWLLEQQAAPVKWHSKMAHRALHRAVGAWGGRAVCRHLSWWLRGSRRRP